MQHARGFIVGCAKGGLWSPGRQSTPNSKLGKLLWAKNHIISILHTGYKVIGYMLLAYYIRITKWLVTCLQSNPIGTNFAGFCLNLKQFYWYKRRGLLFKLRRPRAFQLSRGLLLGAYWLAGSTSPDGGGNPTISRKPKPKSLPPASPSPSSPT